MRWRSLHHNIMEYYPLFGARRHDSGDKAAIKSLSCFSEMEVEQKRGVIIGINHVDGDKNKMMRVESLWLTYYQI